MSLTYIKGYICKKCNHNWKPKDIDVIPKQCPKCHNPKWDTV